MAGLPAGGGRRGEESSPRPGALPGEAPSWHETRPEAPRGRQPPRRGGPSRAGTAAGNRAPLAGWFRSRLKRIT